MRFERIKARALGPLRNVDIDLRDVPGPLIAITGANGAGKSTLLELLAGGLYRTTPTRGSLVDLATARDALLEVTVRNGAPEPYTLRHLVDAVSKKSEAVVIGADGAPVTDSGKVREVDAWVSRHLPPPEVLYTSTFAAQGSGGFLDLRPADRKRVLLRVLGIERLEALAEDARKRASAARERVGVAEARLRDERGRAPAVEDAERDLLDARAVHDAAAWASDRADRALADAQRVAEEYARAERERTDLRRRLQRLDEQALDATRRREQAATLARRADQVRVARERVAAIEPALRMAREALATVRERLATEEQRELEAVQRAARRCALSTSQSRLRGLLREAGDVDAAAREVERLEGQIGSAREEANAELEALAAREAEARGLVLDAAGRRITALREALHQYAVGAQGEGIAADAIDRDQADAIATGEAEAVLEVAPDRREATKRKHAAIIEDLERRLSTAKRAASQAAKVAETRARLEAVEAELAQLDEAPDAGGNVATLREQIRGAEEEGKLHRRVLEDYRRVLADADAIAAAASEREAAERDMRQIEDETTALRTQLADLEVGARPDVDAADEARWIANRAQRAAVQRLAGAEHALERARESATRVAELEAELSRETSELADWTRLGQDLGRDGIQALEIDAAGPELSEIASDLLHTCVSRRWTLDVRTQRTSADGRRQLEGCDVVVVDTEAGREGEAGTFSGGERVLLGEALSLALSVVACRRLGVEGPTLVRDESGAALDPVNGRAYVAMLRRAAALIGAHQVLFVSHTPELQELADARIEIRDGEARVVMGNS